MGESHVAESLETVISGHQEKWSNEISELNSKIKCFGDLIDLQNIIYAKRQDALDYYFTLLSKVAFLNKEYKKAYAEYYNYYKTNPSIKYSTESAINGQISAVLSENIYQIDLLSNHAKYMQETIKSLDDIIYGINNRIRIEELIQGVKR